VRVVARVGPLIHIAINRKARVLATQPGRPSGHYSKAVMCVAGAVIPQTIQSLPSKFVSIEFLDMFAKAHPLEYEIIVRFYLADQPLNRSANDRIAHAKQVRCRHESLSSFAWSATLLPHSSPA